MRSLARRLLRLSKWLRPGIHVKRWVLLFVLGVFLVTAGLARLATLTDLLAFQAFVEAIRPPFISPQLNAAGTAVIGGGMVVTAVFGLITSLLSAFRRSGQGDVLEVVDRHHRRQRGPKVVAIGGGHGLNTLLRGLKAHTDHITAIVTVADDGGSSGRLRREMGILPPGDFRNCIAALSDAEGTVTQLLQYRFGNDSGLDGHSFGNLYLTAMTAITGSFEAALEETSRVLAVRGKVLPSTLAQVTLHADVAPLAPQANADWRQVHGEANIAAAGGKIERVYLEPEEAPAYPAAVRAILEADLIVAGPGSLYTSVLPNLLVRDLAQAIAASPALKVYVCNVATQRGETDGYDVTAHLQALRKHVGSDLFRIVLANDAVADRSKLGEGVTWVRLPTEGKLDYRLIARDLIDFQYPWRHDSAKLAQALMELVKA